MKTKEGKTDQMHERQCALEYLPDDLKEKVRHEIEKRQNIAFMEGYQYAIAILEQSMTGIRHDVEKSRI